MSDRIETLRQPSEGKNHQCDLPEPHWRSDDGLIVRCMVCRRRWRAVYLPPYQGMPACMVWRRRYWPWPR